MISTYTVAPGVALPHAATTLAVNALEPATSLSITPVIHAVNGVPDPASRTFWSAVANRLYITRERGHDIFGPTPDLSAKLAEGNDVIASGRRGPIGCDAEPVAGMALWEAADRAAQSDRPGTPVAHHIIGFLPLSITRDAWRELVLEFLDRQIVVGGMVADYAIHALADAEGRWLRKPHFHAVVNARFWKSGRRTGEPNPAWLFPAKQRLKAAEAWAALTSVG